MIKALIISFFVLSLSTVTAFASSEILFAPSGGAINYFEPVTGVGEMLAPQIAAPSLVFFTANTACNFNQRNGR